MIFFHLLIELYKDQIESMDSAFKKNNIYITAVVVTYEPQLNSLSMLLASLREQVQRIVVVDNSSEKKVMGPINKLLRRDDVLVCLGANYGIARAQNIGILKATENPNCSHILLSDQDSNPDKYMVQKLLIALETPSDRDSRSVAVSGPTRLDERTKRRSFFMLDVKGRPKRSERDIRQDSNSNTLNVMSLIASGSLIPVEVLSDVGLMKEDYFIDHVDTEWCFRARQKGYRLVGVKDAFMHHCLGDNIKKVWFFGDRGVTLHSPVRNYYMFRNTFQMIRDVEMSHTWKFFLMSRVLKVGIYSLVYGNDRRARLKLITKGISHGFMGYLGKLNLETGKCEPLPKDINNSLDSLTVRKIS